MSSITRRDVLATGLAACACALCPAANALPAASDPVDVGTLADFPTDGAYDKWASSGFFLVRRQNRLYALSSVCTHKEVRIVSKDNALRCPKHGSIFSLEGEVKKAPARKSLDRFAISRDAAGRITVDPSQRFDQKRWGDSKCFVECSA